MELEITTEEQRHAGSAAVKFSLGPGSYEYIDFITEMSKKPNSFKGASSFKSPGRESPVCFAPPRGRRNLGPGSYEIKDFVTNILQAKYGPTYGAKSTGRRKIYSSLTNKKDDNSSSVIGPGAYDTEKYLAIEGRVSHSSSPAFVSKTERFKSRLPPGTINIGPGKYTLPPMEAKPAVSSCFRSQTARFKSTANKVPGPGSYTPISDGPQGQENLSKIGKLYGLFFPVDYYP